MEIDLSNKGLEGVFDIEQYCIDNDIDAKKVTYLQCDEMALTELKGLDKLVNLEVLNCRYNYLRELNVSKLVNLKNLYCSDNKITELKGLDNLVNLEVLHCGFNQLTELDVSKLVNLKWLNGEEYIQPEPKPEQDKLEKLEQDIAEIKTKI
jgi:Leucine-rich repeat (LRR) protein